MKAKWFDLQPTDLRVEVADFNMATSEGKCHFESIETYLAGVGGVGCCPHFSKFDLKPYYL